MKQLQLIDEVTEDDGWIPVSGQLPALAIIIIIANQLPCPRTVEEYFGMDQVESKGGTFRRWLLET